MECFVCVMKKGPVNTAAALVTSDVTFVFHLAAGNVLSQNIEISSTGPMETLQLTKKGTELVAYQ